MGTYEKAQIQSYVELKRVIPEESVWEPTGDLNNCDRRATITGDGRSTALDDFRALLPRRLSVKLPSDRPEAQ